MRAVVITRVGGPEAFEVCEVPTPEPRGEQVLIRVRAAGANRADLMQARGQYPPPPGAPADIPGLEFAGEVAALGSDCKGPLKVGDRVFGIVSGGGLAEYVTCHERMAVPIPANLDFEQAAAVPEVFITALDALEARAEVRPGERVLIQAAAGGVGTAAVQIAHAMGCTVFGTSRTAEKLRRAEALGLDVGIDTTVEQVVSVVRGRTNGEGVHAVIDHIGAPALAQNLEVLMTHGRLVLVGLLGGAKTSIDLLTLLRKRLKVVGTTLRARPLEEKIAVTRRFAECVVPWLARGLVRPVIDHVYDLDDIRSAQARIESNAGFGKVVVRIG
ncbi:MAG: NAD(P)H-quinone oxidoreductase [Isosphaeraceae bacterium]|nr:NAD(P)H-quinone oxidoreductase [Isosphaeraceae bacterium]